MLKVTNASGTNSKLKSNYISVTSPGASPTAKFSVSTRTGPAPLLVKFSDSSTGTWITSWEWDFDNNGMIDSTVKNPEFTYTNPGTYSVMLTVKNASGSD